jgi:hypothetical protein
LWNSLRQESNIKIQRTELMALCSFVDPMPPLILALDIVANPQTLESIFLFCEVFIRFQEV